MAGAADDKQDRREEAARLAEQAHAELEDDNYSEATRLWKEAVNLLPDDDHLTRWSYLLFAANACLIQGNNSDDREALLKSIFLFISAFAEIPRDVYPLQWAATQSDIGTAFFDLGQHDRSIKLIQDALFWFRSAQKVYAEEAGQAHHNAFFQAKITKAEAIIAEGFPDG